MPLQKILFKPGVNRENTRYTTEGGWYECDKIRFRQGNPESIGGWTPLSLNTYLGVCRSLWNWMTLSGYNLLGLGTNLKFYLENGGAYFDITPIRSTVSLPVDPFAADGTTAFVTVHSPSHGASEGDFVTFSGCAGLYDTVFNQEFQIVSIISPDYYTIQASVVPVGPANYGGAAVVAVYQIPVGLAVATPQQGWGAGAWNIGSWGLTSSTTPLRVWSQSNFGEDLIFGPRGGGIYYWSANAGLNARGEDLSMPGATLGAASITAASPAVVTLTSGSLQLDEGAAIQFAGTLPTGMSTGTTYYAYNVQGLTFNLLDSTGAVVNTSGLASVGAYVSLLVDVPTVQNLILISDASRFVIAFGTNEYGGTIQDPMLVRWSDQEDPRNWTPNAVNQAGSLRLSHGTQIVTAIQTRQEIFVLTDSSAYSLQYLGPPYVWGSQLLGDNISIVGQNAVALASGVVYWMGVDKFYFYDGRVQTLNCDLRRHVFQDIDLSQGSQVFAGTNEGFNEVWWFYCSANSNAVIDRYVVFNYLENVWYYGSMSRTAWLDSGLRQFPQAATYVNTIVYHENGLNDNVAGTAVPLEPYITSSEFDIGDGHNFGYVWRILPDLTFENSTNDLDNNLPRVTMTLYTLLNSGSGVTGSASSGVSKISSYVITEEFTGQIYTRCRGRQMMFRIGSNQLNTAWQLGAPRIDIRPDGRR